MLPTSTASRKGARMARKRKKRMRNPTEARHPRRPGAHVSQADGPGPAADPRAGGRDLQAHRGGGTQGAGDPLPVRLYRPRAPRSRPEADGPARALRPRDPRQEDREPRALHEGPAAALSAGSKRSRNWTLRSTATKLPGSKNPHFARISSLSKSPRGLQKLYPKFYLQAEGHRGIRALWRTKISACFTP